MTTALRDRAVEAAKKLRRASEPGEPISVDSLRAFALLLEELAAEMPVWRPMSEAPRDGSKIDILTRHRHGNCERHFNFVWRGVRGGRFIFYLDANHHPDDQHYFKGTEPWIVGWMSVPLPAPPSPQDDTRTEDTPQ
jgi:hypothetical protein